MIVTRFKRLRVRFEHLGVRSLLKLVCTPSQLSMKQSPVGLALSIAVPSSVVFMRLFCVSGCIKIYFKIQYPVMKHCILYCTRCLFVSQVLFLHSQLPKQATRRTKYFQGGTATMKEVWWTKSTHRRDPRLGNHRIHLFVFCLHDWQTDICGIGFTVVIMSNLSDTLPQK